MIKYNFEIFEAEKVDEALLSAMDRLMPQLSNSNGPPKRDALEEIVTSDSSVLLLAVYKTKIVGSLTLIIFRIPTGLRAWIEDVVVDEGFRGQGVGEALNKTAIERARNYGAKTVDLTSRPSREVANRLYSRLGFTQRETNVYRLDIS